MKKTDKVEQAMNSDLILLIDANKYLDLYRVDLCMKLLPPLKSLAQSIFVSRQIVSEVQRNRNQVASDYLLQKFEALKIKMFALPDNLSPQNEAAAASIRTEMRELAVRVQKMNDQLEEIKKDSFLSICQSKDEVSITLASIFANAVEPSEDEFRRAHRRWELGNPPGKNRDPIGDQLTWEQVLTRLPQKTGLWIISRDGDYTTKFGKALYPNQVLVEEANSVAPGIQIRCFGDLADGLTDFMEHCGKSASESLSNTDAADVKREEESLPPVKRSFVYDALSRFDPALIQNQLEESQYRASSIRRMLEERVNGIADADRLLRSTTRDTEVAWRLMEQRDLERQSAERLMNELYSNQNLQRRLQLQAESEQFDAETGGTRQ